MKISSEEFTNRSKSDMRYDVENQQETSNDSRLAFEVELNGDNPDETEPFLTF